MNEPTFKFKAWWAIHGQYYKDRWNQNYLVWCHPAGEVTGADMFDTMWKEYKDHVDRDKVVWGESSNYLWREAMKEATCVEYRMHKHNYLEVISDKAESPITR